MKVFKLVAGILCIVLAAFVMFQSCAAGLVDAMEDAGGVSGAAGSIVAIALLAGGIVMIATRNSEGKGGAIATAIIFVLAAIVGFAGAGVFGDLIIWSALCIVLAIVNVIPLFLKKKAQ